MEASNISGLDVDLVGLAQGVNVQRGMEALVNTIGYYKANQIMTFTDSLGSVSDERKESFLLQNPISLVSYLFNSGRLDKSYYDTYRSLFNEYEQAIEYKSQKYTADSLFLQMPINATEEEKAQVFSAIMSSGVPKEVAIKSYEEIVGQSGAWWGTAYENIRTNYQSVREDTNAFIDRKIRPGDKAALKQADNLLLAINRLLLAPETNTLPSSTNPVENLTELMALPVMNQASSYYFNAPTSMMTTSMRESLKEMRNLIIAKKGTL